MGPIAVRRHLRRHRRRNGLAALAVLVCAAAIALHHTDLGAEQPHHDTGMSAAVEMCLAAFTAVGAAVAAVAVGLIALGRWRPPLVLQAAGLWFAVRSPVPRARAGPGLLLLLCVSRR